MDEVPGRSKWRMKVALAVLVLLGTLVALRLLRQPWIRPLPGVRVEMSRPFLRELDLAPDSAYRLLLEAIEEPLGIHLAHDGEKVWQNDWTDALTKLELHPFPRVAPPPSVKPLPAPTTPKENPGDDDDLFPAFPLGTEQTEQPEEDSALAPEAPWTREQWEDIRRLMELYEPNLAILDQAIAAPNPQVPTADSPDYELHYVQGVRQLARWLAVSAQCRAAMGDMDGAVRDIERLLDMAPMISRGGCLINHLVTYACDAIATQALWRIVLRYDLPPAVLKELSRSLLEHADGAEPTAEAFRAEALIAAGATDMVYGDGILASLDVLDGGAKGTRTGGTTDWLAPLVGSTRRATKRNLAACYQHLIAIAEKPYSVTAQAEYSAFETKLLGHAGRKGSVLLTARDPVGYLLASMLLPAFGKVGAKAAQHDVLLRSLAVFCAVEAYRKENGHLPATLEELVPRYLPSIPDDAFDGKPLRYLTGGVPNLPPDAWAIYSVGENFADNGGKAHSEGSARSGKFINPDLVWPSCPYPAPGVPEATPDGDGGQ